MGWLWLCTDSQVGRFPRGLMTHPETRYRNHYVYGEDLDRAEHKIKVYLLYLAS